MTHTKDTIKTTLSKFMFVFVREVDLLCADIANMFRGRSK